LSCRFSNPAQAKEYFLKIRHEKPRYIRDQLQHIEKLAGIYDMQDISQAIVFCIENKIYRATDLESVLKKIHSRHNQEDQIKPTIVIDTVNRAAHKIIPNKSDISDYQSLMN